MKFADNQILSRTVIVALGLGRFATDVECSILPGCRELAREVTKERRLARLARRVKHKVAAVVDDAWRLGNARQRRNHVMIRLFAGARRVEVLRELRVNELHDHGARL